MVFPDFEAIFLIHRNTNTAAVLGNMIEHDYDSEVVGKCDNE